MITGLCSTKLYAQLAAYTTQQNEVMVWDNGIIRKIDYLRPVELKVGRVGIAYLDNARNFKIYHNGGVKEINRGFTNKFQVTDNLITYQNASALYVWENGNSTLLTKSYGTFYTSDSLVVYFDDLRKSYNVYYNGKVQEIEGFLAGSSPNVSIESEENLITSTSIAQGQLSSIKVSDNIAAYINYSNQFKVFFKGMIWDLEDYGIQNFGVGRNTLAYVDLNSHFKIMHDGAVDVYETFAPQIYGVGDDVVAFVNQENKFKIFYNDSIYELGNFEPQFKIKDNIVTFRNARGYFSVFYKGKVYELESFIPDNVTISYNSIVYTNRSNILKMFTEGKVYDVISADVPWWEMQYDVMTYRFGSNLFKVFYKGSAQ